MKIPLIFICLALCLSSCGKQALQKQLKEFTRKAVVIPNAMRQMVEGRDTVLFNPAAAPARLVVWIDSADCASCRLSNMFRYDKIINYAKESNGKFVPIFIFSPSREQNREIIRAFAVSGFDYPVFIDESSAFFDTNPHIPNDAGFHSFLIGTNGKVILVGDPSNNSELWKLYKTTIDVLIENDGIFPE